MNKKVVRILELWWSFYVFYTVHEVCWIRISILSIFITGLIKKYLNHKMCKSYFIAHFSWFQLENFINLCFLTSHKQTLTGKIERRAIHNILPFYSAGQANLLLKRRVQSSRQKSTKSFWAHLQNRAMNRKRGVQIPRN